MNDRAYNVSQRQGALRQLYAVKPEAAMITKRVFTTSPAIDDPYHVTVSPQNVAHPKSPYAVDWALGLDEAVGGLHDAPNPGDMLCAALAACQESTLRLLANHLHVELEELSVQVEGRVDVRGCLAIDLSVPVGFQNMTTTVRVRAAAGTSPRLLEQLCAGAEMLCVDLQTLRKGVKVDVAFDAAVGAAVS